MNHDRHIHGKRQRIWTRTDSCRCGCSGRDPWHRQSYKRVVHLITQLDRPMRAAELIGSTDPYPEPQPGSMVILATGVVQLPWGRRVVGLQAVEYNGGYQAIGWSQIDGVPQ